MSDLSNQIGWVTKPLIEVATLQRGYDLPIQDRTDGRYPIFAANGPVGFHGTAKCKGPGVVTGRSGTIGKVHFVQEDYWPLNTSLYVTDFHGNDPKWVYYMLKTFGLERYSQGAGVPTLNRNLIHGESVSVPPLHQQRRIAAILDQADALRAKRREALALLDELQRGIFIKMFGDPASNTPNFITVPLVDLALGGFQNGAYFPKEEYSSEGIEMVHMSDAFGGMVQRGELKRVASGEDEIGKYGLLESDLLIARRSLTYEGAAKPCRVPPSAQPLLFESSFIRIRPDLTRVTTTYLYHYLSSERVRDKYVRPYVTQSTISGINQSNLSRVPVMLPPMDLQQRFNEQLDAVGQLESLHRRSVMELDKLFGSLQERSFRGEL